MSGTHFDDCCSTDWKPADDTDVPVLPTDSEMSGSGDIPRIPDTSHPPLESTGSSSFESQKMERPSLNVLSPSSPGMLQDAPQLMPGQLSVKLWYDKVGHQLIVNVLQAAELPLRPDGRPRSPYVKMYFLPDRSDKSKRRTKTMKKTCEPKWNQTFVYSHVHRRDFRNHMLELTIWDQPRSPDEDSTFMGEILIELETALLDDKPHWYPLQTHDVSSIPLPRPSPYLPRRHTDAPGKKLQRSQRVTEPEFDEGTAVVSKVESDNKKETKGGEGTKGKAHQSHAIKVPPENRVLPPNALPVDTPYMKSLVDPHNEGNFDCRMALLFDLVQNGASVLRQANLDAHKSAAQLDLEKPLETALLLSLGGVGCVVLNQWPSSLQQNARVMVNVLDNLLRLRQTCGQTVHTLRKGDSSGHHNVTGSHDQVLSSDSKEDDETALTPSAFNCVLYGLPNFIVT